ncbi:MAG: efflux RND transporter permease subunit [Marinifilaceae bacterium]|jgi:multidrug efflux pump subunit AcrB|nr:efflux RND transporter permease subunit [Marinifilaceae bacterium]
MNITELVLEKKKVLLFVLISVVIGGFVAFSSMSKLEDAEISVKTAVVATMYPGASPHEVELRVTQVLENAIQEMDNIDNIRSKSRAGYSEITVNIKKSVKNKELPQLWDLLRRKVNDSASKLPREARKPMVFDDYGDVYGIFLSVSADGYSYEELQKYSRYIKRELLLVEGVKRINLYGEQTECLNIELSNSKLAYLGIHPNYIIQTINNQNNIVDPGTVKINKNRIRIASNGSFNNIDDIKNLLIQVRGKAPVKLSDIASINKSYYTPYRQKMKYNQNNAIGLAISMKSGGNVIKLGERIQSKLDQLETNIPVGININKVFYQPERVKIAINDFMINLIESVLIVVVVLLLSMGLRAGLIIGSGLIFTILATFIAMLGLDIALQRVSLSAIIVAMGMLVDNSIVVADGILIDLKRGVKRKEALTKSSEQLKMPLLGATLVAILAFLPIYLSPDSTGEFCASLFMVVGISLFLSWIFALTQTPYFCDLFLKGKKYEKSEDDNEADLYSGKFYVTYRKLVEYCLKHKIITITCTILLLFSSFAVFKNVKKNFFPNLAYNQFIVEYILPESSDISSVENDLSNISAYLKKNEDVINITTSLGATPARYTLVRPFANPASNYGELIVDTKDYETVKSLSKEVQKYLIEAYPQARARVRFYGPISNDYMVEAKFSGPDPKVLRDISEKAKSIMRSEPSAQMETTNWKNQVMVWNPEFSQTKSRQTGITRTDVANGLSVATNGLPVGIYNEDDKSLPILLKTKSNQIEDLKNTPIWGNRANSLPLSQIVEDFNLDNENPVIHRYNRRRAIIVQCDPAEGFKAAHTFKALKSKIENIKLPEGYDLEWLGEHKNSKDANENIGKFFPLAFLLMIIIIMMLFNNFRQPIIILTILPLSFIGISYGLLITGKAFGFMAIVGTLGLIGMMIKNVVVLLDQINIEIREGKSAYLAIVDSAISRTRPVLMASLTTILGMIPLIPDELFGGMAVAIMFGLFFGSIITLIIVPVLYAALYKVKKS